jgi:Dipeptidyl aminopeptidases/acylaminoacyl-peptidases
MTRRQSTQPQWKPGHIAALTASLGLALALATSTQVMAQASAPPPLEAYGALPQLEMVQLSPTGRRIAFVTTTDEQRVLGVFDREAATSSPSIGVSSVKVRDIQWIDDSRVLVTTSQSLAVPDTERERMELFQGNIYDTRNGRTARVLHNTPNLYPVLLETPSVVANGGDPLVLVRAFASSSDGSRSRELDLYQIDAGNGRARRHEAMPREVNEYVLDASGRSVARTTYDDTSHVWVLQLKNASGFREVWRTTEDLDVPNLIGLGLNGDSVIVAAERPDLNPPGRERVHYFDVNLETGVWRPLRFDFVPQGLIFHPATRRLIGATRLNEDGAIYAFADEAADELWYGVEGVLGDQHPSLVSWTSDLKAAVVFTSGNNDSGTYHLIDLVQGTHQEVGHAYRAIADDQVAPVTPISYRAQDGLEIHGYLTTPRGREARDLPLVVLVHGGPEARDTPGFDWWSQALASRGYAVLQANYRGSSGYGEAFTEAGHGEWGRKMQTDLSDGVRWLVDRGTVDPRRVCIVGASYGGYAAMAGPTLDPGVYRCAAAVSGVSDLRRMILNQGGGDVRNTNSAVRYWNRFMGGTGADDRSLDAYSPAQQANQADAPMLLLHGRDDSVVPLEQSQMMADALQRAGKPYELIVLDGEDHWLSRGHTRGRMLAEIVRFLEAQNPPN